MQTHLSKGPELRTKSLVEEQSEERTDRRQDRRRREPLSSCCGFFLLALPISLQARGLVKKKKDNEKVKKMCMTSTNTKKSRWYPLFHLQLFKLIGMTGMVELVEAYI